MNVQTKFRESLVTEIGKGILLVLSCISGFLEKLELLYALSFHVQ